MLVGIDASRAAVARRTGTENYSLHLIRGLLALDDAHRYRLYFNQPPPQDLFGPRPERRVLRFPRIWTHVALSWEMLSSPPDLLFVPSHVLPLLHPGCSVATVHDLGFHYYPEAHTLFQNVYLRWSTRHNARASTLVLADSLATQRDLIRYYGLSTHKVSVVYPGRDETLGPVNDPSLLAAVRARHDLQQPYLLYVGTLHPRKNLVRLVQAFAQLLGQPAAGSADLILVLAGQKGWLYHEISDEVRRLGLRDRVRFTGYVDNTDLPALLSGALAFVFPSLYEGFGLPVVEAMACGTPVVCSHSSSLPEAAGDAALLVDPLDAEAITAALVRVVGDGGLRRALILRGFEQAQKFSWQRCAHEARAALEEAYRRCRPALEPQKSAAALSREPSRTPKGREPGTPTGRDDALR
jgi:glycosyltransferase involved in cell wall biosynthesis